MKAPRTKVFLIAIYCIISGLLYIGLAVISICSYACAFDFTKTPVAYMMYLLYFRKSSCHSEINWSALGIDGSRQPSTPQETSAVLRTLTFSVIYLVLNFILVVGAFRAMAGVREKAKNRHVLFWSFFAALFFTKITIIVLDFLSSAFYLVEFFLTFYNSDNVMTILEIDSPDEYRQYFEQLSANTRSMPSMIFFLVTSKVLLILTVNFALVYVFFVEAWKICRENQKFSFNVQKEQQPKRKESTSVMSIKSLESDATLVAGQNRTKEIAAPAIAVATIASSPPPPTTVTNTTQTDTYKPSSDNDNDDNSSSRDDSSSVGIPELRLPRVPYEKSSLEYNPRRNTFERSLRRF